ncbi:MAG: hypothetical protein ACPGJV_09375 [Bacteriovoracaceae bacterium]
MKLVIPSGFVPPQSLEFKDLKLEVLAPVHNELDYEAWTGSKEGLRGVFGPDNPWPFNVSNLESNKKDLQMHLDEFETGIAYTYTILTSKKDKCFGCLYIRQSKNKDYECRVDFWFIDSVRDEYSEAFFDFLKTWLQDKWSFSRVAFPGRTVSWDKYLGRVQSLQNPLDPT